MFRDPPQCLLCSVAAVNTFITRVNSSFDGPLLVQSLAWLLSRGQPDVALSLHSQGAGGADSGLASLALLPRPPAPGITHRPSHTVLSTLPLGLLRTVEKKKITEKDNVWDEGDHESVSLWLSSKPHVISGRTCRRRLDYMEDN